MEEETRRVGAAIEIHLASIQRLAFVPSNASSIHLLISNYCWMLKTYTFRDNTIDAELCGEVSWFRIFIER